MKQKFKFLCGYFEKISFVYAVKLAKHSWYYFEECDSLFSQHSSLPEELGYQISLLDGIRSVEVLLDDAQASKYIVNGIFVFKEKEVKTSLQLSNLNEVRDESSKAKKDKQKTSEQLCFTVGKTNPLYFLDEFEKCRDVKADKDKVFKIRNFVPIDHRVEFSELYFTSDWTKTREVFLRKYSKQFTTNKKKATCIDFQKEPDLQTFVKNKLASLETYTTLPFINQVEIMLLDLPNDVANLFLVNGKMKSNKKELLKFCDTIDDVVKKMNQEPVEETEAVEPVNRMEIYHFDPNLESNHLNSLPSNSSGGRGLKRMSQVAKSIESSESTDIESDLISSDPESVGTRRKVRREKYTMNALNRIDEDYELGHVSDSTSSRSMRSTRSMRSKPY